MDKKAKLYDTWAIADKPLLDKTKRIQRLSSDINNKDSSDENSDRDSDSNDFLALPREFRPNLKMQKQKISPKQTKDGNTSLNQTRKDQPIQNLASEKTTNNSLEKGTFHNSTNQDLPLKSKEENSLNNISSVLKTGPKNKIQYQIVKKDNFHQVTKGKMPDETSKNVSKVKKSLSSPKYDVVNDADLMRQQRALLLQNEDKNEKSFKYEHVQTNQRTLHLNFDNLSLKDTDSVFKKRLTYETRLAQNTYTNYKNVTQRKNRITKQNTKQRSSLSDRKFFVSSQESTIRWDSSLKLDEDNKIEWSVIREKTSLRVRSKIKSPELNNESSSKDCHANRATMNSYEEKFNNSTLNKPKNNYDTKPKAVKQFNVKKKSSNSSNFELNNNLLSSIGNNFDYTHTVINSDSTSDSDTWDSDQCIYSKHQSVGGRKNVENRLGGNLSCATSISVLNGSKTVDHRKEQKLPRNKNQNGSSLSQQATKDLKLPSHYSFQNSPWEATVESNIGDHNKHEHPLSIRNKKENESSQLQKVENSLNIAACHNFNQRGERSDTKLTMNLEDKKESILQYGKKTSDLIIGSHTTLNVFISVYREWAIARKELIHHFEELKQQLKESSTRFSKIKNILKITNTGAAVASAIPHPVTSMVAKVATVITSLLQTFLNNKGDKSNVDNSDEMTIAMLKDNSASYELYMYGLQCSQQFEETTKLIEKFHSDADIQGFYDRENPEITTFIRGFLEYKPNHQIFYKKLHKCFQELLQSSNTNFSRTFCEPFTLYSLSAVDVIGHLRWRFRNEDFDGSSVRNELDKIQRLIQNSSSISLDDLQKRIQTCIEILTDELKFVESTMKDISIFDSSLDDRSIK